MTVKNKYLALEEILGLARKVKEWSRHFDDPHTIYSGTVPGTELYALLSMRQKANPTYMGSVSYKGVVLGRAEIPENEYSKVEEKYWKRIEKLRGHFIHEARKILGK